MCIERGSGVVTRPGMARIANQGFPVHKNIFERGDLFVDFKVDVALPPSVIADHTTLQVR